jgi:hypothetical protein
MQKAPGGGGGSERIYSVSQLSEALNSGLMGLKDQLQVLSILDGSSSCWPGVSAASSDLESLVRLAGQHLAELEKQSQQLAGTNTKLQEQITQLNSKLKGESDGQLAAQSCCWPESNPKHDVLLLLQPARQQSSRRRMSSAAAKPRSAACNQSSTQRRKQQRVPSRRCGSSSRATRSWYSRLPSRLLMLTFLRES